jgi:hypothetical protein
MFVFDHLFKTAGTTFHSSYLPAAFAPDEYVVLNGFRDENVRDQTTLAQRAREQGVGRLRIVAGHHAEGLRPTFPQARFVTVVREPVARAVSAYLHVVFHPDAQRVLGTGPAGTPIDFSRFVEDDTFAVRYWDLCSIHDGQARTLLGPGFEDLAERQVIEILAARYAVVGHTERFDEFLFYLHAMHGFPLCLYNNRLVRPEYERFEPTPAQRDLALRHNRADARLHTLVCREFGDRLAALGQTTRALLSRYLATLETFRRDTRGNEHTVLNLRACGTSWKNAKYHYSVFGVFPGVRDDAVTGGAIPLDHVTPEGGGWRLADGRVAFEASPEKGTNVSTLAWPAAADGVRAVVNVDQGELALAAVSDDRTTILAEASVGRTSGPVAVDLWPSRTPGFVLIRNADDAVCTGRVLAVHPLRAGVGRTPAGVRRAP